MSAKPPPLTAAQEQLLLEHWTLPLGIYHKLKLNPAVRRLGPDDAHGTGLLIMVYSVRRFDPQNGVPFACYVAPYVRWAILDAAYQHLPLAVPHNARRGYALPAYRPAEMCDLPASPEADPADAEELAAQMAQVRALLPSLPWKHREAIERHYLDGQAFVDISRATGVTLEAVRVRTKAGLRRLRAALVGRATPSVARSQRLL